jgi:hypothetical protein
VGCATNLVRDLAALVVVLEERGVPEAPTDAGSAGREGRAYVVLVFFYIKEYYFEPPYQKRTHAGVDFVYEHKEGARL